MPGEAVTPLQKQEQEPARATVEEVAPDILRMQLPVNFPGLGHVNMYGLVDKDGLAVVDPGLPDGTSWEAVARRLAAAGFRPDQVHTVVVTHSHPDHFGAAGRLAAVASARLVTHAAFGVAWLPGTGPDVPDIAELPARDELFRRHLPWSDRPAELSQPQRDAGMALVEGDTFPPPVPTHRLSDGEVVRLGAREWFALHTPGHTTDHLCLHDPETGVLLTGDHVLPSITPHVGGLGAGPNALSEYVEALDRVAALADVCLALPAHGHPFTDVSGRVSAIKEHHRERLAETRRIGAALGPATVEEFSHELFRREYWGLMAQSETYAHLEHLRLAGEATASSDGPTIRYRIH